MYFCGGSDLHPYECDHDKYCEHCTLAETEWHNPSNCALCDWLPEGHPDKGKLTKICDEPFAIRITVRDYSHKYQKLKFTKILNTLATKPQVELPF